MKDGSKQYEIDDRIGRLMALKGTSGIVAKAALVGSADVKRAQELFSEHECANVTLTIWQCK